MKLGKREITKFRENYEVQESFTKESVALAVTFDEKDDVKRLRAKWNPAEDGNGGFWSIGVKFLNDTCPFDDDEHWGEGGSGTVLDWLNNHKMIHSQFGNLTKDLRDSLSPVRGDAHGVVTYSLEPPIGIDGNREGNTVMFQEFECPNSFPYIRVGDDYMDASDGREKWNALVEKGYTRSQDEVETKVG